MTNPPITIPVPLPDTPEKSAPFTAMLKNMETLGLIQVTQAVIVTTPNATAATLIRSLLTSPAPQLPEGDEKPKRNVYRDLETDEEFTAQAMGRKLNKSFFEVGKRFSHHGNGLLEVVYDFENDKQFLRKVQEA